MKKAGSGYLWKRVAKDLWRRIREDDISALGAQLSYSFLLAFFPFLIFAMTLIGCSSIKSDEVLLGLKSIVPLEVYKLTERTVREVVDNKDFKLLSFSIITAIWTASNGFLAVIKALNKAYDIEEKRGIIKVEIIALSCTVILAFIIVISFVLIVFGEINGDLIIKYFGLGLAFKNAWNYFRYLLVIIIMIFIFSSIYHFIPCRKLSFKEVLPGGVFTSIGWIIFSEMFSYYVNNFSNYSMLYGSIGAVIILMTWLFLISILILIGGEINATLALCRDCK
ncbi:MAG: YihY/virulence factor BrkB family protein [Clostridiaceae bacterium]|nr:YihY/virulence factor BrkB family protein [Clostridiaceae bacterium]